MSVKTYRDKGYARVDVNDEDVKDTILTALGFNEGDLMDGLVFDGKVVPTVTLNTIGFYWVLDVNTSGAKVAGNTVELHHNAIYTCYGTGEWAAEVDFGTPGWIEVGHIGGASPTYIRDFYCFGDVDGDSKTRFRCIVDGQMWYRGFMFKGLVAH